MTLDEKLSGVRAKIALFSSESTAAPGLGKFQSSEDVAKASGGAGGSSLLTRAHTHSDVRFEKDESGLKRQSISQMSLKSLKTEDRAGKENGSLQKSGSNLKPQNKSTSFRSMINVSSSQVLASSF